MFDDQLLAAGLEDHQDEGHQQHFHTYVRRDRRRVLLLAGLWHHEGRMAHHHHKWCLPRAVGIYPS